MQSRFGQPLVVIWAAMCAGLCVDRAIHVGPRVWWAASLVLWLVWFAAFSRKPAWSGWLMLTAIGCAAAAWHNTCWRRFPATHVGLPVVADQQPKLAAIRGRVSTIPEFGMIPEPQPLATIPLGIESTFTIDVSQVRDGDQWLPACGKLAVRVDGHVLGLNIGDHAQIFGVLTPPLRPMNPGQRDASMALRTERILCRLDVPYPDCILRIAEAGLGIGPVIGRMRQTGLSRLDRFVGGERALLAGALVLGARDRLQPERVEAFFRTGTIHLLAISGLHVGILAWGFFVLAKNESLRRWSLLICICFTVVYCILTGMRPPVLRAAVLVQVACIGLLWRRNVLAYNALAAAAVVVLILQPAALFRPGAQLSFLAVATLIWLGLNWSTKEPDPFEQVLHRARPWLLRGGTRVAARTWQLFLAGLAIWVVTMPLVMFRFHLVSPVSLLMTVVLALPIAVSLLSGFAVLVVGGVFPPAARVCGYLCDVHLAFVESTVGHAAELPGAFHWVAGPSAAWCAIFYVVLFLLAMIPGLRPSRPWAVSLLLLWFALPIAGKWVSGWTQPKELRCTFLSVGHGTCVVLETPDRRVLLYDCGRMGIPQAGVRSVSEFLWYRGIGHLDGVVLSHADADHYNIVPGLIERFSIGQVVASPRLFESQGGGVEALAKAIHGAAIPVRSLHMDDVMTLGKVTARVSHPPPAGVEGSDNANSIVLDIVYRGRRLLLPGDLESPGLEQVIAEAPLDCDVLMAPHHGSLRSSPKDFIDWCTPEWVVISSGPARDHAVDRNAPFAHAGATVLRTSESGAITVVIGDDGLHVKPFRTPSER